jgi:hypothetical protein
MLIKRKTFAATALLIWLGAIAMAESPEPPRQTPSIKTEQQSDGALKAQPQSNDQTKSGADATVAQEKPSAASETKSHDQPKEGAHEASEFWTIGGRSLKITDTLLVVFTFLLFLATVALFWATRDLVEDAKHSGEVNSSNMQAAIAESRRSADAAKEAADVARDAVKLAEKTAERQLRAYVFADALEIRKFGTNEPLEGWLFLKNSGATPSYEFERGGKLMYTRFPATEFPQIEWGGIKGYLAPHGEIFFGPIPLPRALTAAETANVIAGTHAIYLFGKIKYRDAFGHQRGFEFRSYYRGNGTAAGPVLTTQQDSEGNTAD